MPHYQPTTAALARRAFLTVEGHSVSYLEWGHEGLPPMVLLHESKGAALSWEWFAVVLAGAYHVFALDALCRGHSDWVDMEMGTVDDEDYRGTRIGHTVSAIETLIAERRLDPVILVGTGSHGCSAALFGVHHPEQTRAMILDDGTMLYADYPEFPEGFDISSAARNFDGFVHFANLDEAFDWLDGNTTTRNDPRSLDPDWMDRRVHELFVEHPDGTWTSRPPRPDDAAPVSLDPPRSEIPSKTSRRYRGLAIRAATEDEIRSIGVPTLVFYNATTSHWAVETADFVEGLNPQWVRMLRVPGEKTKESVYVSWSAREAWLISSLEFLAALSEWPNCLT